MIRASSQGGTGAGARLSGAPRVLVIAETMQGKTTGPACELLGLARHLADETGGEAAAALLGNNCGDAAEELIARGADTVYVAEHALLGDYHVDAWVPVLARICRQAACDVVLICHNAVGADLAPRLAFRLETAVATGCVEVALSTGRVVLTRPCYGGNAREVVSFKTAPAIATVRPGCYNALPYDSRRSGSVVPVRPEIDATAIRTRIVGRKRDATDGVRLEDAKVIVAGGRGLNGADGFRVLEKLAHTLGGAVGASRVPCDLGWCPRSWQIGLTGRTVTPDLYIAVGISGAGHHMAGCGSAKTIVAVNTDPEAAIFKDARYGVVGDYQRFIPAFIAEVEKLRG
jgi:electron transfer flavoprotein alpha subunit